MVATVDIYRRCGKVCILVELRSRDMSKQESTYRLILMPSGRQGDVADGTTVLDAAQSLGVEIESICGGRQTCGKCLVSQVTGHFDKHAIDSLPSNITQPDTAEQAYAAKHNLDLDELRLACAACIVGDVLIHIPEESLARKQVIRKAASELQIEVAPAVRLVYVEVEPAELGKASDWRRIQDALAEQWDLHDIQIDPTLLPELQSALRDDDWKVTLTLYHNQRVIRIEPGYNESLYGMAVDVGSTTIAGYLCDLRTGEVVATETLMNPQVKFGEDLMSRVSYGMMEADGVDKLHRVVIKALNDLSKHASETAGIDPKEITELVLVGNTVMHHLFLGIDPVELGAAPFALAVDDAVNILARELGLRSVHSGAMVHVLPCIAGHVGADNVAVLLAELDRLDEKISLVVDIGTNAEILLANDQQIFSASSPTGPAFEGAQIEHGQRAAPGAIERVRIDRETGQIRYKVIGDDRWSHELADDESLSPTGICGSGIIEVIAELLLVRWMDNTGLLREELVTNHPALRMQGRVAEVVLVPADKTATGREIVVTQNDIRAIQLAKGALYAGIKLLMDHMGINRVDRIKLAGAFGTYIDPKYAMILGLIPDCDLEFVQGVGNSAGDGARIALLNVNQRNKVQSVVRSVQYVETAVEPDFQTHFVAAMNIPHASDPYPHLADVLPSTPNQSNQRLSREERRLRRKNR